jgi:biopolymer transport protein ExbD
VNPSPHDTPKIIVKTTRSRPVISLTPLIDVVFILLVFFMLASSFTHWRVIALDVTSSEAETAQTTEKSVVTIDVSESAILIEGRSITMGNLVTELKQKRADNPKLNIQLKPVEETSLQRIVDLLNQLKSADINRVNLIRDPLWQRPLRDEVGSRS